MWIPEVQAEGILTDREGGGPITLDYAVSYQKGKESRIGITCMWISWKKLDPGPNSKTYLLSLYTLILIVLVIVPTSAATVGGAQRYCYTWRSTPHRQRWWFRTETNPSKFTCAIAPGTSMHPSPDACISSFMWNLHHDFAPRELYVLETTRYWRKMGMFFHDRIMIGNHNSYVLFVLLHFFGEISVQNLYLI